MLNERIPNLALNYKITNQREEKYEKSRTRWCSGNMQIAYPWSGSDNKISHDTEKISL